LLVGPDRVPDARSRPRLSRRDPVAGLFSRRSAVHGFRSTARAADAGLANVQGDRGLALAGAWPACTRFSGRRTKSSAWAACSVLQACWVTVRT
jgi:hypothetical protein